MDPEGSDITLDISPYFGATCKVIFQDEVKATVHRNVIPADLRISTRYSRVKPVTLDLKDIDTGTGHMIVHFLYSGKYESPKSSNCSGVEATIYELELAFKVHSASLSLNMETLQILTEDEILKLSDQLSFPSLLEVVENSKISFARFPKFAEYLQSHLISLKMDSLDQTATDILLKIETPDTFCMVLLKTLIELGRKAASNQPDVDREYSETELSFTQSLAEQADEIDKANKEIETLQRKEKQGLQLIQMYDEITVLYRKKGINGGKLTKKYQRQLEVLEKQIAACKLEHNQEKTDDQSGEVVEEEDRQSTDQSAHHDEEPAEVHVEQDTPTEDSEFGWGLRKSRVEVGSSCSEVSGNSFDWEHVPRTDIRHSLWVPSASGSVDFLSSSGGQVTPSNSESLC